MLSETATYANVVHGLDSRSPFDCIVETELLEVIGNAIEDGVISVGSNVGTGTWRHDLYECYIDLGKRTVAESEKQAFFKITSRLNLDPDRMSVSRRPNYGCGGAMGAAQFLPSTWLRFESQVAQFTNHFPPNPWNPEDAFIAAAMLLSENGATARTFYAERLAALRYFAGWGNANKAAYAFYGDDVMDLATKYQGLIDILNRT